MRIASNYREYRREQEWKCLLWMSFPLKPSIYLILLSLVSEARHGYAIRKRVMQHSDNAVRLDPGTLYRHMARLLKVGWIREAQVVCDNDPRRRYYELTDVGTRATGA